MPSTLCARTSKPFFSRVHAFLFCFAWCVYRWWLRLQQHLFLLSQNITSRCWRESRIAEEHTHFAAKDCTKWLKEASTNHSSLVLRRLAQLNQTKVYLFWKNKLEPCVLLNMFCAMMYPHEDHGAPQVSARILCLFGCFFIGFPQPGQLMLLVFLSRAISRHLETTAFL